MEWVLILGLAGVAWWQASRLAALSRRVYELERRLTPIAPQKPGAAAPPWRKDDAPLVLDTPLREHETLPPLVLDTPLPPASNDDEPDDVLPPLAEPRTPLAAGAEPPRVSPPPQRAPGLRFEQWLARNGFAWLGGGAVALAGILLVAFASGQSWFTPHVRLFSAIALGVALIGASAWVRRLGRARPPGHPLVAALLAGAGASTFYATAWAAHGVYGAIAWPAAAALLTLCATILIGLSYLHGQAFGVLAILSALIAPPLASAPLWPSEALTLYVSAVGVASFALAAWRRWSWAAVAVLAGLYYWFFAAIAFDEVRRALAFASVASLGASGLAFRPPHADDKGLGLGWTQLRAWGPSIAVAISSVLLIWVWLAVAPAPSGHIAGPALISVFHVALAAYAVRARIADPTTLAIAVAGLAFGFMAYLRARFHFGPLGPDFFPTILFAAFTVAVCAIGARPHRRARAMIAGAGAVGAALLTMLAAFSRGDAWHAPVAWAPLFIGGALLFAAAWRAERETQKPHGDSAVDLWAGAGAVLILLGVESAFPAAGRIAAHAGVAAVFAAGVVWRDWRVLRFAALGAAALAIAHALAPHLIGATLAGRLPLAAALGLYAAAALLLFSAAYLIGRRAPRMLAAEGLSGAAILVLVTGALVLLQWFANGGAGGALDQFTLAALRALTLLAAGHIASPAPDQQVGRIGAWRGHALMGAGLGLTLFSAGLALNPWWGGAPAAIAGPPLFNTMTLALAAPAALLFAASYRLYDRQHLAARIYAAAGGACALMWLALEVRRAFRPDAMSAPPVGLFEGGCYALLFLAAALALAIAARLRDKRTPGGPFTRDLVAIMRGGAWTGLGLSVLILLALRHPIWGMQDAEASKALSTLLAVFAQGVAVPLALLLGRALSRSRDVEHTRFAAASAAILFAWSFGHSAIRWFEQRGYMDNGNAVSGLEGFGHALWPLILVVFGAALTARAPGRDTVRPYLYDLQALWATAIWPALGFAGLGLWALFNPWWGLWPATTPLAALAAVPACVLAAGLSAFAPRIANARWPTWLARAATLAVIAHLFVAMTLMIRRAFHQDTMTLAQSATQTELWIYSAAWALFGAAVFWLGSRRDDALMRWCGLALLLITTAKVFLVDMARLSGLVRVLSFLGLGAVLLAIAWIARRAAPPKPKPTDLLPITPSARRGTRRGRRQRSQ